MRQLSLAGVETKVEHSLKVLQTYAPKDGPYFGAFSGGKDSCVIKELAKMAGVSVVWHYSVTTIDPPELVRFIRDKHPDVLMDRPKHGTFFHRAAEYKGFPTRVQRWCCEEYKETAAPRGSVLILGVRAEESPRRAARWREAQMHFSSKCLAICPILAWTTRDVWDFIHSREVPYCSLYDEGAERLGCIGCPMERAANRLAEFARYPRYEALWKRMFARVWERKHGTIQADGRRWFGDRYFQTWEQMWEWWLTNGALPEDNDEADEEVCQLALDHFSS